MRFADMRPTSQDSPSRYRPLQLRSASRRAFSIVELIVVVLVMSILAAVAVPTFVDSLMFHRVETAARRVKADLELARHTARLTSTTQTLTVIGAAYDITAAADLNRPTQAYRVDLSEPPYEVQVSAVFVRDNLDNRTDVSFDGYGVPNSRGVIILRAGSCRCDVLLDRNSGEVTIESNHSRGRSAAVDN